MQNGHTFTTGSWQKSEVLVISSILVLMYWSTMDTSSASDSALASDRISVMVGEKKTTYKIRYLIFFFLRYIKIHFSNTHVDKLLRLNLTTNNKICVFWGRGYLIIFKQQLKIGVDKWYFSH